MNDLQKNILDVYKEFIKVCEKYNLRYYASSGSLLGTIRHKGFIPWDDDIDISMPIEDYNKLFFSDIVFDNPNIKVRVSRNTSYSTLMFNKIENANTTMIEKYELNHPSDYKGIYIDIFPLYGVESKEKAYEKLSLLEKIFRLNENLRCDFKECDGIKRKIIWIIQIPLRIISKKNFWYDIWNKTVSDCYDFDSKYTVFFEFCKLPRNKVVFERKWFDGYVDMPFEDTYMRVPIGYDDLLKVDYGNYLELPPVDHRRNHSNGLVDINKPYSFYVNEYKKNGNISNYINY